MHQTNAATTSPTLLRQQCRNVKQELLATTDVFLRLCCRPLQHHQHAAKVTAQGGFSVLPNAYDITLECEGAQLLETVGLCEQGYLMARQTCLLLSANTVRWQALRSAEQLLQCVSKSWSSLRQPDSRGSCLQQCLEQFDAGHNS